MHVAISEVFPYSSLLIDVMSLVSKYGHDPFVQIIVIYIYMIFTMLILDCSVMNWNSGYDDVMNMVTAGSLILEKYLM